MMFRTFLNPAAFLALGCLTCTRAEAAVLYDASLNSLPGAQGWGFLTNPLIGAQATQGVGGGVLALNTGFDISEQAGYFSKVPALSFAHPANPTLDLSVSPFSIEFTMRQVSGSDLPDTDPLAFGQRNRGGFAVIAISDNLTGIELQFQTDHIVALDNANTAFPVGESQAFDTTDMLHDYELILSAVGYALSVDGSLVLQGPLRNYSGIAPSPPVDFPYKTPNFLFFGDDTGRAEALTELARFEVTAVPEPSQWLLMIEAMCLGLFVFVTRSERYAAAVSRAPFSRRRGNNPPGRLSSTRLSLD